MAKAIRKPGPAKKKVAVAKKAAPKSARQFIEALKKFQSDKEKEKIQRYFKSGEGQYGAGDQFMGVKMGSLFSLAKSFHGMPAKELEKMLESPVHEVRAGAVSIMDKESRTKSITPPRLKEFFDLYMRRHDRINNWDLVDLGCLYMTGFYLYDKPRSILDKLVKSKNLWERRTAILSTCFFIRKGETTDTFRLAEKLLHDPEDLVHKATGWMLRFAGDKNPAGLIAFLNKYAPHMPRTMLRGAIEKLDKSKKSKYMARQA